MRVKACILTLLFIFSLNQQGFGVEKYTISTGFADNPTVKIVAPIIKEAYKRLNIEVQINNYPWQRALHASNVGIADAELFRSFVSEEEYPNLIKVDSPVYYVEFVACAKDPSIAITGWESIKQYDIGFMRGVKTIEQHTRTMNTASVNTAEQAFNMLKADYIDIVVAEYINGLIILRKLGTRDIFILEPPIEQIPVYHFVNKRHADLLPLLKNSLKTMNENGELYSLKEQAIDKILHSSE